MDCWEKKVWGQFWVNKFNYEGASVLKKATIAASPLGLANVVVTNNTEEQQKVS